MALSIEEAVEQLLHLDGLIAMAAVDCSNGMILNSHLVQQYDMELAAAAATEVLRAEMRAVEQMGGGQDVDDVLIQTTKEMHLLVPSPATSRNAGIFSYLVLSRDRGNLALARRRLHELTEQGVDL